MRIAVKTPRSSGVHELRQVIESMRQSSDAGLRRTGQRLSVWLMIATAKTPAERHQAVARLEVSTMLSRPGDGRRGVLKTYVAKGKPRLQRLVAGMTLPTVHVESHEGLYIQAHSVPPDSELLSR
jgi:hypothetical protein